MSEDDVLGLLSTAKKQQAAVDTALKVLESAVAGLASERKLIVQALGDVRTVPETVLEPLKTAVEAAAASGVKNSMQSEKKALGGAVKAAVERIDGIADRGFWPVVVAGLTGAIFGGVLVGGTALYAIKSGAIVQTLNSAAIAQAIQQHMQQPAQARRR